MAKVLVTMVTILLVLCSAESQVLSVSGVVGGRVLIKCKHTLDNIKYFCRGSCTSSDIIIQTTDNKKYTEKGRYSIHAFGNGDVTVIINDLQKTDSGTYWCGVDRVGVDTYQQVYLSVEEGFTTTTDTTSTILLHTVTYSVPDEGISTGSPVVIMVCVGLAVLMLGLILLLMYKWGKHRNSSHPVNHPVSSAEDSTYYNLTRVTQDPTPQDSTYQTLNTPQDSTYQTLNTTPKDSTYQTLNTTPKESTYQTLNT